MSVACSPKTGVQFATHDIDVNTGTVTHVAITVLNSSLAEGELC